MSQEGAAERIGIHPKHLQRIEGGRANPTVATVVAIGIAYGVRTEEIFAEQPAERGPFHVLAPARARPYDNCVPLYPLEVAAGVFGSVAEAEGAPDPAAWVVPHGRRRPGKGLFVARVVGESMSRRIPSGSYCLFRAPVEGGRQGRVLLVEHRDIQDPDSGGHHTVKIWRSRKTATPDGSFRLTQVTLLPDSDSPGYRPIVLGDLQEGEVRVIAELVEVLPG